MLRAALKAEIEQVYTKFEIEFRSIYTDNGGHPAPALSRPPVLRLPAERHTAAVGAVEVAGGGMTGRCG